MNFFRACSVSLSIRVELNNTTALPFVCEIEGPKYMRNLPADDCQSPDFIKLCSIMKDELDRIHTTLERNVVFDMLVEGNDQVLRT